MTEMYGLHTRPFVSMLSSADSSATRSGSTLICPFINRVATLSCSVKVFLSWLISSDGKSKDLIKRRRWPSVRKAASSSRNEAYTQVRMDNLYPAEESSTWAASSKPATTWSGTRRMGPVRVQPSTSHHSLDCFVIQQQLSSRIATNNFVFVDIFVGDVTREVHRGQRGSNKGKKEWRDRHLFTNCFHSVNMWRSSNSISFVSPWEARWRTYRAAALGSTASLTKHESSLCSGGVRGTERIKVKALCTSWLLFIVRLKNRVTGHCVYVVLKLAV